MDRNNGPKEKWWRTCPADSRRLCNKEGQKNNKAKRQIYSTTAIKIKFWVIWSSIEDNDEGSMVIVFMISFSIYLHLGSDITRIRLFIWYSYTLIGTINSNNKNKIYLPIHRHHINQWTVKFAFFFTKPDLNLVPFKFAIFWS